MNMGVSRSDKDFSSNSFFSAFISDFHLWSAVDWLDFHRRKLPTGNCALMEYIYIFFKRETSLYYFNEIRLILKVQ